VNLIGADPLIDAATISEPPGVRVSGTCAAVAERVGAKVVDDFGGAASAILAARRQASAEPNLHIFDVKTIKLR
jgi:hypothetical protein